MKEIALISLLWPKNNEALKSYLSDKPCVVLTLSEYCTPDLIQMVESCGGRVETLDKNFTPDEVAAFRQEADFRKKEINAFFQTKGWSDYLVERKVTPGLTEIIERNVDERLLPLIASVEALDKVHPKYFIELLLVNEDTLEFSKLAVQWARDKGIPSLHLTHGLGLPRNYCVDTILLADRVAVFGARGSEMFLDGGVPPEKIRITGNPAWDKYPSLINQRPQIRQGLAKKYGFSQELPIVVFGTSWNANLSAFDNRSFSQEIEAFLGIYPVLQEQGISLQLVIKDRPFNEKVGREVTTTLAEKFSIPPSSWKYTVTDTENLVLGADIVISSESNLSVECSLVGTPAINLISDFGLLVGTGFAAQYGIPSVEQTCLVDEVHRILTDSPYRQRLVETMQSMAGFFNVGIDGGASKRVAVLMREMARKQSDSSEPYVWQRYLNVSDIDATGYHGGVRGDLVDFFSHPPSLVLDIGCAAGGTGAALKAKFPHAKVYGIELNKSAAAVAVTRLDKVMVGKFEEIDLEKEGVAYGSIDGVIVADVLEHMYNPWDVLVRLRPYLASNAKIIASIPNVRNLALMGDLSEGYWRYESLGLLDITHIRFFTLKEIRRFFHETGYHVSKVVYGIDGRLKDIHQQYLNKCPADIEVGRMVLRNVARPELDEMCSLQFYLIAEVGANDADIAEYKNQKETLKLPAQVNAYEEFLQGRQLDKMQAALYENRMAEWGRHPTFHIAILATQSTVSAIGNTIQSLADQLYYNVRITVLAPQRAPAGLATSERFEWRYTPDNLLSGANLAFEESAADWVGVVNAGDKLVAHALLFLAEAAFENPQWNFIYTDEDTATENGKHEQPHFKPDFNLDLLHSIPYIGGLCLIRRDIFRELGGFNQGMWGVEEFDLVLRGFERIGSNGIGHFPDVLYHRVKQDRHGQIPTTEIVSRGRASLESHFARLGVPAKVESGNIPGSYKISYRHSIRPLVSVIISTHDHLPLLQRCIESLLEKTVYPNYEVLIVDNDSRAPDACAFLEGIKSLGSDRMRVLSCPQPLSFSAVNNFAAQNARGEYLLLLDNDTAVLHPEWLDEMMNHALRPEVGVVGARLLFHDKTIQHAGMILGLGNTAAADYPFVRQPFENPGYWGRLQLTQNYSAVSSACLLIRKSVYEEIHGMDEGHFKDLFSDVDLCLKVREKGYLIVWTPYATLLNEGEGGKTGAAANDDDAERLQVSDAQDSLWRKWLPQLAHDPAYNPNLSFRALDFSLESNTPLCWDPMPWRPLPYVAVYPGDIEGCGKYRISDPVRGLTEAGEIQGAESFLIFSPPEIERLNPASLVMQRQVMPEQIEGIKKLQRYHPDVLRVYELDDLLTNLPQKNPHRDVMPKDIAKLLRQGISLCDRFVVSTERLAECMGDMHSDIRVVPNTLRKSDWGHLKPLRRQGKKPRVGWAGGISHVGDLEVISDVVIELADKVDWVFFGLCPERFRPYVKEVHAGVPVGLYPAKLASLNLDLAIAPLEFNQFNECKSHLKLLEYGVLGYPIICTDIIPYQGDYPVKRVANRHKEWVEAIMERVNDLSAAAREGNVLREYVLSKWMLEDNLGPWKKAWLP